MKLSISLKLVCIVPVQKLQNFFWRNMTVGYIYYLLCTYLKITLFLNVNFIMVNIFPFCQMNLQFYFLLNFQKEMQKEKCFKNLYPEHQF